MDHEIWEDLGYYVFLGCRPKKFSVPFIGSDRYGRPCPTCQSRLRCESMRGKVGKVYKMHYQHYFYCKNHTAIVDMRWVRPATPMEEIANAVGECGGIDV